MCSYLQTFEYQPAQNSLFSLVNFLKYVLLYHNLEVERGCTYFETAYRNEIR